MAYLSRCVYQPCACHNSTEMSLQDPQQSIWQEIVSVLRGHMRDYTRGSIFRAIVLLAIPMVLEMLMQSIFELVDAYFVGQLGAEALNAVGAGASLIILVLAIAFGMTMGVTAMVARRIGEKDPDGAGKVAFQAIAVAVGVSIPIAIGGILFAPQMLRAIATPEPVVELGSAYCAILFGSNLAILLLFVINAIFRGAGDAMLALKALALANALNIILDPILIFGWGPVPAMGLAGAAWATAIGRTIGVLYQVSLLLRNKSRVRIRAPQLDLRIMARFARISAPAVFQMFISTACYLALFVLINTFGENTAAAYTVSVRIIVFALLPAWGLGNAAATLVGQNLGAGEPERAERSVWVTCFINSGFLGLVAVGMNIFAQPLMEIFTQELEVVAIGSDCIRIISYTYVLFAFGMVTTQAFNGSGDTWTPTWIAFVVYWCIQLPLGWALAYPAGYDAQGIFAAVAIAQALLAIVGSVAFRMGKWKLRVV